MERMIDYLIEKKARFKIYNKSNVTFCGQRLYTLNLLKKLPDGTKEKVPAFFTELENAEDLKLLEEIEKLWTVDTSYGGRIISHFKDALGLSNLRNRTNVDVNNILSGFDKAKYFVIECPQFKNLKERIRTISEIGYRPLFLDKYKIRYLQSSSQINSISNIEGQGLNMIGCVVKYAMDNNVETINLIATKESRGFYEKAGFKPLGNKHNPCGYYADKNSYQDILNIIKAKYGEILSVIKNEN